MSAPSSPPPEQNSQTASARLASLVRLGGTAEHFWSHYLQAVGQALSARRVLLLTSSVGRPWQARAQWPVRGGDQPGDVDWTLELVGEVRNGQPRVRRNGANQLALVMTPSADAVESGAQVLAVVALGIDADAWDETRLLAWAALAEWIPSQWSMNTAMSGQPAEREVSVS